MPTIYDNAPREIQLDSGALTSIDRLGQLGQPPQGYMQQALAHPLYGPALQGRMQQPQSFQADPARVAAAQAQLKGSTAQPVPEHVRDAKTLLARHEANQRQTAQGLDGIPVTKEQRRAAKEERSQEARRMIEMRKIERQGGVAKTPLQEKILAAHLAEQQQQQAAQQERTSAMTTFREEETRRRMRDAKKRQVQIKSLLGKAETYDDLDDADKKTLDDLWGADVDDELRDKFYKDNKKDSSKFYAGDTDRFDAAEKARAKEDQKKKNVELAAHHDEYDRKIADAQNTVDSYERSPAERRARTKPSIRQRQSRTKNKELARKIAGNSTRGHTVSPGALPDKEQPVVPGQNSRLKKPLPKGTEFVYSGVEWKFSDTDSGTLRIKTPSGKKLAAKVTDAGVVWVRDPARKSSKWVTLDSVMKTK